MVLLLFGVFVVSTVCWCSYGYVKGAPHGLGTEGIMYGLLGVFGIRRFNRRIAEASSVDQRHEAKVAKYRAEAEARYRQAEG